MHRETEKKVRIDGCNESGSWGFALNLGRGGFQNWREKGNTVELCGTWTPLCFLLPQLPFPSAPPLTFPSLTHLMV